MAWFGEVNKEARRRFKENDRVRYFTKNRKGTGKGIVLTPSFSKGTVVDFDGEKRRYKVKEDSGLETEVHPRNLVPDRPNKSIMNQPSIEPIVAPVIDPLIMQLAEQISNEPIIHTSDVKKLEQLVDAKLSQLTHPKLFKRLI